MSDRPEFQRLEDLKKEIRLHNHRYYVLNDPLISDQEFDQLLHELRKIEENNPGWITLDSPTQRIETGISEKFSKVDHVVPILSLANAFNSDDLRAWYERILKFDDRVSEATFLVEPKLDGLTVVLHYLDGGLVQGATRGNGIVGEDVTTNLRTLNSIPLRIPLSPDGPLPPADIFVRGEVFIDLDDFKKLNEMLENAGERTYQTPRNTAAGALRQLDPKITALRPLRILCYTILQSSDAIPETQEESLKYLQDFGFPVPKDIQLAKDIDGVVSLCEAWVEKRDSLPFEIDGAVVKINELDLSEDLGIVGKDPRGATAYKFPAQEVTTVLHDIGVKVGRTGVLTPFAVLEPSVIGGVVVSQATLHNFDFIADKDIRVGDRVRVKRAGDVIPYVIGPIVDARTGNERAYLPPSHCPECGEPVTQVMGEVALYCENSDCPGQIIRKIAHFVSRETLDIVGLGIKIVEVLVKEGFVKDVSDLYKLSRDKIVALEGFGEKKADNILAAIEVSKKQSLGKLIFALGIKGVGEVASNDLAETFLDLKSLSKVRHNEIEAIDGFGPNIAEEVIKWFADEKNISLLNELRDNGMWPVQKTVSDSRTNDFAGFTFVITGTLIGHTRNEIKEFITSNGGKVMSSISKNTTYLILGENPGSKLQKAQALGTKIINIDELLLLPQS